jgi:antitoxin ParD1/3/4
MDTTIGPELEEFIEREVASGKFRSRAEVISEGLRLLRERERKLDQLRSDIQVGLDELNCGKGITVADQASHQALLADVEHSGLERLASRQNRK